MSLVFAYICVVMRKRVAYELYDPALSIEDNADRLGCSVASLRKHFSQKGIDRRYDVQYRRWRQVNRYYSDNPESSLRTASEELHCSINTIRKYRVMTEDEFRVSIRIGLVMADKFILLSHYRLLSRTKRQHIARKYHSYFFVFRKHHAK